MPTAPTLKTARLTLRSLTKDDADAIHRHVDRVEIARNTLMIPHPYPDGQALKFIEICEKNFEEKKEPTWAIDDGALNGIIGLMLKGDGLGELGYWVAIEKWGLGYASEATGEVIRYGFEVEGLHRIFACHMTRNPASGRVMQKNGMTYEGTMRQHVKKWDEYLDMAFYGVLRDEWLSRRSEETAR